jgi:hypothetical protein
VIPDWREAARAIRRVRQPQRMYLFQHRHRVGWLD